MEGIGQNHQIVTIRTSSWYLYSWNTPLIQHFLISDGKITKPLLKTRSGEFDIESIHTLNLRDCGRHRDISISLYYSYIYMYGMVQYQSIIKCFLI